MGAVLEALDLVLGDVVGVVVDGAAAHEIPALAHGVRRPGVEVDLGQLVAQGREVVHGGLLLADLLAVQFRLLHGREVNAGQGQADAQVDVGQGTLDGVAALEHGDVGLEHFGQPRVALGREVHVRDGVREVVVLARGVDDQVGLEVFQDGHDDALHGHQVAFVRGARRHGHVDGPPHGLGPAAFRREARARVQGAPVLVQGDEEHVGVVPVDVLGAVAVMAVRVHHGHAQVAVVLADPLDHHGFDVDVAEAAAAVDRAHGVVSGGAHHGEGALPLLLHDQLGGADDAAGGDEVGVGAHGLHVREAEVGAQDVLLGGHQGTVFADALDVEDAFLPELVLGVEEALLALGVGRRDGPVEGREEYDAEAVSCGEHGPSVQGSRVVMTPGRIWQRTRMLRPMV